MISKIIIIFIGCSAFCLAAFMVAFGGVPGVIFSLPVAFVAAYCFLRGIVPALADKFSMGIFMPNRKNKIAPMMLSPIKAKITRNEFDDAIDDIEKLLEKNPMNPVLVAMLSNIYINKLKNYDEAYALLTIYLKERKTVAPEDQELVMDFVDICLELGKIKEAKEFLETEVQKKYPDPVKKAMWTRRGNL